MCSSDLISFVNPYRLYPWEVLEPVEIVRPMQVRDAEVHAYLWDGLDRNTREAVSTFDLEVADPSAAEEVAQQVRRSLNELIESERLIFDAELVEESHFDRSPSTSDDLRRTNRALVEAAFPGAFRRFVSEPSRGTLFDAALPEVRGVFFGPLGLFYVAFGVVLWVWGSYQSSWRTLRLSFDDVRDVDALLDHYLMDLGLKPAERSGDDLVFRGSLWVWFIHGVRKLRARVSGNSVLLTGPTPMMKKLQARMVLLADAEQAAG